MRSIRELVKLKRKELKESQAEFGSRFGMSHAAISDIERGVTDHFSITLLDFVLGISEISDFSKLSIPAKKVAFKVTIEPL